MNSIQLVQQIESKGSFLCVGLDSDPRLIPSNFHKESDPIFAFNKSVIDATEKYAVAYKPNIAFYEAEGAEGLEQLKQTLEYIPSKIPIILDAKRADIGNTSKNYSKAKNSKHATTI
jgi:orotidine-5'-phosphate decarboxylase